MSRMIPSSFDRAQHIFDVRSIPIAPWRAPAVFPDPRVLGWKA
jgi:hypothetical protein